jgi:hypothetical protein
MKIKNSKLFKKRKINYFRKMKNYYLKIRAIKKILLDTKKLKKRKIYYPNN